MKHLNCARLLAGTLLSTGLFAGLSPALMAPAMAQEATFVMPAREAGAPTYDTRFG